MKYIIPIREMSKIEIELVCSDVESNYFKFRVRFSGTLNQEFLLTGNTIEAINNKCKEISNDLKERHSQHNS